MDIKCCWLRSLYGRLQMQMKRSEQSIDCYICSCVSIVAGACMCSSKQQWCVGISLNFATKHIQFFHLKQYTLVSGVHASIRTRIPIDRQIANTRIDT